jgi:hypothetical protein
MFQRQDQTAVSTQILFCAVIHKILCEMFIVFLLDISSFSFVNSCMKLMEKCLFDFQVLILYIKFIIDSKITEDF